MKLRLCLVLMLLGGLAHAEEGVWESMGTEEGIQLYRKQVPGSPVIAVKGEGIIDAPLIQVATVMLDDDRAPEWVDSMKECKVVRVLNPLEYVEYNHIGMPVLLTDRDFVTDVKMVVDETAKSFTMNYHSIDDPAQPVGKFVRGDMIKSVFRMTSIDNGRRTRMEAEVQADPKGSLPKFIVNFFQKGWPLSTFQGIRRQAAKPDIRRPAVFADVLGRVEKITR